MNAANHPAVAAPLRTLVLLLATLSLWLGAPASVPAAEIDSVTGHLVRLDDSMATVNSIFRQRLAQGVAAANPDADEIGDLAADDFCDPERLYRSVRRALFDSFLPRWGLPGYDLDLQLRELLVADSYVLSLQDSIYRDIDFLEGFSLNLKELSDVVRLDGHLVGLDKLGHFFAEGWTYFELTHEDGETLEQAMAWGREQELGRFGYTTTGIHSFADLVANFHGWRFWNALIGTQDDPLKDFEGNLFKDPYVDCEFLLLDSLRYRKLVRAWRLDRRFDLSDYVDGMWDENNNCNSYADPVIEEKVRSRIEEIAPGFACPAKPAACVVARQRYGRFARQLLHPRCLTANSD